MEDIASFDSRSTVSLGQFSLNAAPRTSTGLVTNPLEKSANAPNDSQLEITLINDVPYFRQSTQPIDFLPCASIAFLFLTVLSGDLIGQIAAHPHT